jgi:opacity protein-like surface antigen
LHEDRGAISRSQRRFALVIRDVIKATLRPSILSCKTSIAFTTLFGFGLLSAAAQTGSAGSSSSLVVSSSASLVVAADATDTPPVGATPIRTTRPAGPPNPHKHHASQTDVSLGVSAQLTATRTVPTITFGTLQYENTQGAAPSPSLLATFHQQFRAWLGYNVNAGYTRPTLNYMQGLSTLSLGTSMYELSGSYVAKTPLAGKSLQAFFEGGGGMLSFVPTESSIPFQPDPSYRTPVFREFRAAVLFGAGVDYRINQYLSLRAEYRGLFYKSPDLLHEESPGTKLFTVTSEPTLSLTYRFGASRRRQVQ